MRLVLLGPPGAGKGTQAVVLSQHYHVLHVSTGEMLRDALKKETEAGLLAKKYMENGELVPDAIVTKIVSSRIADDDARDGFVLDGFPRNESQAANLGKELASQKITLDMVLFFKTSKDVSIERLTGRRVCPNCGRNYHIKNMKPRVENKCDVCGIDLAHRNDDRVETIMRRLDVYEKETKPLLEYYRKSGLLHELSGDLNVQELFVELQDLFKKEKISK